LTINMLSSGTTQCVLFDAFVTPYLFGNTFLPPSFKVAFFKKERGNIMRFIIGMLVFSMFLVGCTDQPVAKKNDGDTSIQQEMSKQFKVGDVVKIGDTELSIKSARFVEGDTYVRPKKGKVLEIEIEGKNNGNQSWYLVDTDFNLYDPTGQKLEQYFGVDDLPFSGEVNRGKSVQGHIFYDVPEATSYELIYKPNFLTNQEIKFDIVPSK